VFQLAGTDFRGYICCHGRWGNPVEPRQEVEARKTVRDAYFQQHTNRLNEIKLKEPVECKSFMVEVLE
jgi:hypothetical protein